MGKRNRSDFSLEHKTAQLQEEELVYAQHLVLSRPMGAFLQSGLVVERLPSCREILTTSVYSSVFAHYGSSREKLRSDLKEVMQILPSHYYVPQSLSYGPQYGYIIKNNCIKYARAPSVLQLFFNTERLYFILLIHKKLTNMKQVQQKYIKSKTFI